MIIYLHLAYAIVHVLEKRKQLEGCRVVGIATYLLNSMRLSCIDID